jgi:hypothetical protein
LKPSPRTLPWPPCAAALGAVWFSQRVRWFASDPSIPRGKVINPSAPFLLPLLVAVASALVTGMFIREFDYLYPVPVRVGLMTLVWYRKDYTAGLRYHLRGRSLVSWRCRLRALDRIFRADGSPRL